MWFSDLFAAVGRELTVQEPVMTWNLFLTAWLVPFCSAVSSAVVIAYVSYKWRKRDQKDAKIEELKLKLEEEKEKATAEWRKNLTETMCRVKGTIDLIENSLGEKIDKEDCIRSKGDLWKEINRLRGMV